ncbi:unnamed protein product [Pneumocystis jirovecii]|uniref:CDC45-like protein n=1 Tax=Pneumocystis jirovecii TaxID=42068 RepID=L0PFP7_PNEJI|nr:unnamed protein product [Pneumocystis jirovecii]
MFIRRSNYADAYSRIKVASLSGSCTVLIFVALDVDALCACKMLSVSGLFTLMKQDFISHKIQPISGYQDLMDINQTVVLNNENLKFLILLNCGALIDLYQYLTPQDHISVYVIDSHRPWNLDNAFSNSNIFVFDDGDIEEKLYEERKAYDALVEMGDLELEKGSDDSSLVDEKENFSENENLEEELSKKKHKSSTDDEHKASESLEEEKDQEKLLDVCMYSTLLSSPHSTEYDSRKATQKKYYKYQKIISDYYDSGTWFGECISSQMYSLASDIGKEDNELLWFAVIGLTNQEMHRRMSYINRMNPLSTSDTENVKRTNGKTADDSSIRAKEEFRFMLFRHWRTKLKVWSEYGKKRLHKLFAKMGISLNQCHQVYTHMDMDLKKSLREKLDKFAPLYGLNNLVFPSFVRTFGFKCTLSASDASYGL